MKHKYKTLKKEEALSYIRDHHGKKKQLSNAPAYIVAYECDENTLIIENTRENDFTLYFDREKYYKGLKEVTELSAFNPLSEKQDVIKNFELYKDTLLDQLYRELMMPKPVNIKDVDLKEMDQVIAVYGHQKAYMRLYVNLIVFCGEYVKAHKGGNWIVKPEGGRTGNFEPIYVDSTGEEYGFLINTVLAREYTEFKRMSVSKVISSAMLPNMFEVVPNPTLRNPNEQDLGN